MDAMSFSHPCTDSAFMKGTQIGGSEALYNAIGYVADQVPCPIMLLMPTIDTAKRVSKQRLQPMIDETPCLATRFAEVKSRTSSNTVLMKDFPGGVLVVTGANSGPGLRSMPVRVLLQDEIDAYPDDVDGEGDPSAVADKRTDTYARAKRIKCSTPKIKGKSRIDRRYQAGTQARYYVPCPHCKHEQPLAWEQMRWQMMHRCEAVCLECGGISEIEAVDAQDAITCRHCQAGMLINDSTAREVVTDEIERVWYECENCGESIQEHHKTAMLEQGRHIHHAPGPGVVLDDNDPDPHAIWAMVRGEVKRFLPNWTKPLSWHVSALYSPLGWFSWLKAVRQYLDAQQGGYDEETGESLMQVFENTVKGDPYEIVGEQPKINIIKQRVEDYQLGQVPAGGLLLVAGVDVQGDRLEVEVDAFGRGEECWTVDHQVIHGDPTRKGPGSVWEALADMRAKSYQHAGGQTLRITAMAVDSGYLTQEVYDFCRAWSHRHVFATKGDGATGKPVISRPVLVDINHKGVRIKQGVQLWHVGTDTAKERFYKRLELSEQGPGYHHFPRGLPDEYFEQLAAEKLVRRKVRGMEKHEWVKTRERNEALDLKILCYAAAIYSGLQRTNWDMIESMINPTQQDMFARNTTRSAATTGAPGGGVSPPPSAPAQPQQPAASGLFNAPKTRRVRSAGIGSR
ncbi:phage terminase large subunit GpA-like protein [Nitrosospira sp. Nsp2]|nr:phage terminase large subunit GpA-like protein [Nitrosospira sp. Nsp2]